MDDFGRVAYINHIFEGKLHLFVMRYEKVIASDGFINYIRYILASLSNQIEPSLLKFLFGRRYRYEIVIEGWIR